MKKVLVYGNRKADDIAWDASTPELEADAFLKLFNYLDEEWKVYSCEDLREAEQKLYDAAKAGDSQAAKKLVTRRKSYEYEEWHFMDVL